MKAFREKYGISARRLAELMGITTISNYNRLESGRRPLTLQHKATLRLLQSELEFLIRQDRFINSGGWVGDDGRGLMSIRDRTKKRINEIIGG